MSGSSGAFTTAWAVPLRRVMLRRVDPQHGLLGAGWDCAPRVGKEPGVWQDGKALPEELLGFKSVLTWWYPAPNPFLGVIGTLSWKSDGRAGSTCKRRQH